MKTESVNNRLAKAEARVHQALVDWNARPTIQRLRALESAQDELTKVTNEYHLVRDPQPPRFHVLDDED